MSVFSNPVSRKGQALRKYTEFLKLSNKRINERWEKRILTDIFPKKLHNWLTAVRRCSASLIYGEISIKTYKVDFTTPPRKGRLKNIF